ncbi:MAG: sulfatase-like hydrolase/transferase [Pirellulaceae bacterium]|nr:sulfatase-like hydrolase/transferase [Pirellulaceae bacterium]
MLRSILFFVALALASWPAHSVHADTRPNIVVLLCDDLGYGDLQCYGHPQIKTPNLDRLADSGIRLTDFYSAAPVCSASRVGLLTGRSPNRAGVYDWIPPATTPKPDARDQVHMRESEITIPHLLRQAGYSTCMAGKWHCNSRFNSTEQPQPGDFGFDHWLATQNNAAPSHKQPQNFVRNGEPLGKVDAFSCQFVVDEAIGWLDTVDHDKPFFLYIPFHETHEPVASPEALVSQYRDVARNDDEAQYFANVTNVDNAVGRLLEALTQQRLRDNTLIIFSSDNGPETLARYKGATRCYGTPGDLRGMKLHTTDGGFRVPGIVNWPARIQTGQVVSTPISSLDFLPTFCELAGADSPTSVSMDGTSFLAVLDGQELVREKPLVWAYYNATNQSRVAMRDGKWKVLAKLDGGRLPKMQNITSESLPIVADAQLTDFEIYDLSVDVAEAHDLSAEQPAQAQRLAEKLKVFYFELVANSHVWQPR